MVMKYTDTTVSDSFREEVSKPEAQISLALAGLYFAKSRYPEVDCRWYIEQLELVAQEVLKRVGKSAPFQERLSVLITYLFGELGYRGNADEYYDPKNSFLNEVIERRLGIPISLSVIFLEAAQLVGINAVGVPFPGHFLVRATDPENQQIESIIVDPFDGGSCLALDEFVSRFLERLETPIERSEVERMLQATTKREILIRQFRNLLAIYSNEKSQTECLLVVNHILYLDRNLLNELLHRGALLSEMGHSNLAINDYEHALRLSDDPALIDKLESLLREAKLKPNTLH